ncbi:MAG: hypothetical protein CMH61_00620 [Nanoarchaeota archaeon]|nr:hypothetical protein [Nanoarchaeota archaeon]|tara:strand:+ start:4530 stop:5075 length:546 start_codon:yes stop_codon:yes gene_type:complete
MATFLDIGLLQYFNVIFPVLLVFSIFFALLQKTKILSENNAINAIVAISVSFLFLMSKTLLDLINFIAPWFVFALIFIILLLMIYQTLGATDEDIAGVVRTDKTVQWSALAIGLLILIAGFGEVFGQTIGPYLAEDGASDVATSDFEQNVFATLFHPKILGLIVLFGVAIFAIAFLSGSPA